MAKLLDLNLPPSDEDDDEEEVDEVMELLETVEPEPITNLPFSDHLFPPLIESLDRPGIHLQHDDPFPFHHSHFGMNISSSSSSSGSVNFNQEDFPFPFPHHHPQVPHHRHHHHHHNLINELPQHCECNNGAPVFVLSNPVSEGYGSAEIGYDTDLWLGFSRIEPGYNDFILPNPLIEDSPVSRIEWMEELDLMVAEEDIMELEIDPTRDEFMIYLEEQVLIAEEYQLDSAVQGLLEFMQQEGEEDNPNVGGTRPAASIFIQNLPSVRLTREDIQKSNICAVCTDEFSLMEKVTFLPCSHYFHGNCILPWLNMQNTCPLCRHEFPTDDFHQL